MDQLRLGGWALLVVTALAGCGSSTGSSIGGNGKGGSAGSASGADASNGLGGDGVALADAGSGAAGVVGRDTGGVPNGAAGAGVGAGAAGCGLGGSGLGGSTGKIPIGTTQCSDGKDNDGDGLIDSQDPECTGPRDNDESSYATGIPGDNVDPKWQDCFFDGNSGGGDDGCRYSTKCLTGELPLTDKNCSPALACQKFCMPLTPNGFDCFGCCAATPSGG